MVFHCGSDYLPTKAMKRSLIASVFFFCCTALANDLYQSLPEIPIGGEGGWDILTIDSAASRLYLSHATKVVVVDLKTNSVTGEIADTPGVHAFVAVPEVQPRFFVEWQGIEIERC